MTVMGGVAEPFERFFEVLGDTPPTHVVAHGDFVHGLAIAFRRGTAEFVEVPLLLLHGNFTWLENREEPDRRRLVYPIAPLRQD
jgi:hypothetical protein